MASGFPTLQPAFVVKVNIAGSSPVGVVASGSNLTHHEAPTGTIKSAPGFTPEINAQIVFGGDFIYTDPDGLRARLNIQLVAKTDDNVVMYLKGKGIANVTEAIKGFLAGTEPGKTAFGRSSAQFGIEVAAGKYKDLENHIFVGNGRFVREQGGTTVEFRLSVVVPSTAME
ncbi:hypothetical protein Q9L58_008831 [Maublancomyces gigas]|uniref:Uncharacterized protein n=1 Tax=Discina gigas TaxID=1032678 RepID=A0ABR3G8N5_9PEZI